MVKLDPKHIVNSGEHLFWNKEQYDVCDEKFKKIKGVIVRLPEKKDPLLNAKGGIIWGEEIFAKGKEYWNEFVKENPKIIINFSFADLTNKKKNIEAFKMVYEISFSGFNFPNNFKFFIHSKFGNDKLNINVSFMDAQFGDGYVYFRHAQFGDGDVSFMNVKFGKGNINFEYAKFGNGNVDFRNTQFGDGDVSFMNVKFGKGNISFERAKFGDDNVYFMDAKFGDGYVSFMYVKFGKGDVIFDRIGLNNTNLYLSYQNFQGKFFISLWQENEHAGDIDFYGTKFNSIFDISTKCISSNIIPNFSATYFEHHCALDNIQLNENKILQNEFYKENVDLTARATRLKELAKKNENHELALACNALELKKKCKDYIDQFNEQFIDQFDTSFFTLVLFISSLLFGFNSLNITNPIWKFINIILLIYICFVIFDIGKKIIKQQAKIKNIFFIELFESINNFSKDWIIFILSKLYGFFSDYGRSVGKPVRALIISGLLFTIAYSNLGNGNYIKSAHLSMLNIAGPIYPYREQKIEIINYIFAEKCSHFDENNKCYILPFWVNLTITINVIISYILFFLLGLGIRNNLKY